LKERIHSNIEVLEELKEYEAVLAKAEELELRWLLAVDF
tara:strand:- start:521 stop:637 length:117 start_codon:yes stop_codon:yes gene_type:complete